MNNKMLIIFSLFVGSLFLYGFEGKVLLGDYKAKNAEEEKIIEALISYEKAYNEHNLEGAFSYCTETVKLRPCAEFVQVSKEDFVKRFPGQFYIFPTYIFYNPAIDEYGGKADLNLQLDARERHGVLFFIEQGLMPRTGKRYEWEVATESGDPLSKLFRLL